MAQRLLLSFLLTSAISFAFAQKNKTDSTKVSVTDTIQKKINHDIFIGVDLFNPVVSAFTDKQGVSAFASYQLNNKWHLVAESGYEKNKFDQINWNVDVDGVFAKLGANWFITQDVENQSNGIYIGGRIAYSKYSQTINSYPIRDLQSNIIIDSGSRPKADVSAFWVEAVVGGRQERQADRLDGFRARYLGSQARGRTEPPAAGKTADQFAPGHHGRTGVDAGA